MAIALNAEQERVIGQAIEAVLIQKTEDSVEVGFGTIRQRLETNAARANV
jgi:hypothetical protein